MFHVVWFQKISSDTCCQNLIVPVEKVGEYFIVLLCIPSEYQKAGEVLSDLSEIKQRVSSSSAACFQVTYSLRVLTTYGDLGWFAK